MSKRPASYFVEQVFGGESSFWNFETYGEAKEFFGRVGGRIVKRSNFRQVAIPGLSDPTLAWDEQEVYS